MEGRDHLEDLDLDGRGILKWMLMKKGGKVMMEWIKNWGHWRDLLNIKIGFLFGTRCGLS